MFVVFMCPRAHEGCSMYCGHISVGSHKLDGSNHWALNWVGYKAFAHLSNSENQLRLEDDMTKYDADMVFSNLCSTYTNNIQGVITHFSDLCILVVHQIYQIGWSLWTKLLRKEFLKGSGSRIKKQH